MAADTADALHSHRVSDKSASVQTLHNVSRTFMSLFIMKCISCRLAHGGVPTPVNPLPAQQPYGDPATPFHYHDNHDHLGYQPDPVLHSNQPQYDYDPYGYQGNTNHITDLQQTDAQVGGHFSHVHRLKLYSEDSTQGPGD